MTEQERIAEELRRLPNWMPEWLIQQRAQAIAEDLAVIRVEDA